MKQTRYDVMLQLVATALMYMAKNGQNAEYATMQAIGTFDMGGVDTFDITRAEILTRVKGAIA